MSISMILFVFLIGAAAPKSCCPWTRVIKYSHSDGTSCGDLTGAYESAHSKKCVFQTCQDLEDHRGRWRCGRYDCDFWGCGCGGCVPLDDWGLEVVGRRQRKNITTTLGQLFRMRYERYLRPNSEVEVEFPAALVSDEYDANAILDST